jgi:hypothetical protein
VHAERRRGRQRSRILYWFRTPPGVRVGRSALDEDAIRLIEENNPGLEFDWVRILKGEGAAQPDSRPRPDRPDPPERRGRPERQRERPPAVPADAPRRVSAEKMREITPRAADLIVGESADIPALESAPPAERIAALEPSLPPAESTAAQARLGSEGLQRLRARHAEVLARISEKIADPIRREELKSQADRLNPDTWVTDAEVVAGLEQYESVFEALRAVVGRRRRRRKRRGAGRAAAPGGGPAGAPDAADTDSGDTDAVGDEDDGDDGPEGAPVA